MGYFVGAISGTSIDGLDLALINVDGDSIVIENATTVPFPENLQAKLINLAQNAVQDIVSLGRTHVELGTFIGDQVVQFVSSSGYSIYDVVAIGSHGQTIRHVPKGKFKFSFQIGDASRIAAITGIDTVADFRSADVAVGGQGAPLVPVLHERIFRSRHLDRCIVNIGGIANVTVLPVDPKQTVIGFDTGPGNALLDAWALLQFHRKFDKHGEIACSGSVIEKILDLLLDDPWFTMPPPKSTGKEQFNINYIQDKIHASNVTADPVDVLTTLTEFTAITLSRAIKQWCFATGEVIVCGGGRMNKYLMLRLDHHLANHTVRVCDELGYNGDAVEAATFGYLAYLFLNREPGNIPAVTGAKRKCVLGSLYPASIRQ